MGADWTNLVKPSSTDPLSFGRVTREAQQLAPSEPDLAVDLLSGLKRDLQDAALPVEVFRSALKAEIDRCKDESVERLRAHTEDYFERSRKWILEQLASEVDYGTQFVEAGKALRNQLVGIKDRFLWKGEVKSFFVRADDDPRRAELIARARALIADFEMKIVQHKDAQPDDPVPDSLTGGISAAKKDIADLEKRGVARFKELEETGFFDAQEPERRAVLGRFDPSLIPAFAEKEWLPAQAKNKFGTGLLGELLEDRFGEEAMNRFREGFFPDEEKRFVEFWKARVGEAALPLGNVPDSEASAAAPGAAEAVAPLVEAGTLAARWHTMAWAMANLFPPNLTGNLPAAALGVIAGKDATRKELAAQAQLFVDRLLAGQRDSIEGEYREQVERSSRRVVDGVSTEVYRLRTGFESHMAIVRSLTALDAVTASLISEMPRAELPDFFSLAGAALDRDDCFAAAALAIQAYDACVDAWAGRAGLVRGSGPDRVRRTIELMRGSDGVSERVVSSLQGLRSLRNRWARGMVDLRALPENERQGRVRNFLETLDKARVADG